MLLDLVDGCDEKLSASCRRIVGCARLTVDVQAQYAARPDLRHLLKFVVHARLRIPQIDIRPIVHARVEAEAFDEELAQALHVWRAEQASLLDVSPDLQEDGEGVFGLGWRGR